MMMIEGEAFNDIMYRATDEDCELVEEEPTFRMFD